MPDITSFGLGAAVTTTLSYISSIYQKIRSFIFTEVTYKHNFREELKKYLVNNYYIPFFERQLYSSQTLYDETNTEKQFILKNIPEKSILIHNKNIFKSIYVSFEPDTISISYLIGMYDKTFFFEKSFDSWNKRLVLSRNKDSVEEYKQFRIEEVPNTQAPNHFPAENYTSTISTDRNGVDWYTFDFEATYLQGDVDKEKLKDSIRNQNNIKNIFIPPTLTDIENEIVSFIKAKDWYNQKEITWKRGYLLYGSPGNGKTFFINYISYKYGFKIFKANLSLMTNQDFIELFIRLKDYTKCILLIEDIDSVFDGRTNINSSLHLENLQNQPLSFDIFLNALDGVNQVNGILLFITTNNLDKVDDALKNRPSRIDKCVLIENPNTDMKKVIANQLFDNDPIEVDEILKDTDNYTTAQFKEKCINRLLTLKWNN